MCAKAKDHNVEKMHVNFNVCKGKGTVALQKCMLKINVFKGKGLERKHCQRRLWHHISFKLLLP